MMIIYGEIKEGYTELCLQVGVSSLAQAEDCQPGWKDGREAGLGCLLADITTADMNVTEAWDVCRGYGEGGRLVEINSSEQMSFLKDYLTQIEEEWEECDYGPGFLWWWLGLNDQEVEKQYVGPGESVAVREAVKIGKK